MQEQRIWHEDVTTRFQPQQGFEDLVFTSKTNRPIHESNIRSSIEYIVDRINAQNPTEKFERFTPHCLRHTFATNCIAKGMRKLVPPDPNDEPASKDFAEITRS